ACPCSRSTASCSGGSTVCRCCVPTWTATPGLPVLTGKQCVSFPRGWRQKIRPLPHPESSASGLTLSCQRAVSLAKALVGFSSERSQCHLQECVQLATARSDGLPSSV